MISVKSIGWLVVASLLAVLHPASAAEGAAAKTVRLGFFESGAMYRGAGEGLEKGGFCYDFMMEIATRAGWKYEFVYGSFFELYEKLKTGEIDVIPYVIRSEIRQREVFFSKDVLIDDEYYLAMRPQRGSLTAGMKRLLEGKTISTPGAWFHNSMIRSFLDRNRIKAEMKIYPEIEQCWEALRQGQVDATVLTSLTYCEDEWLCIGSIGKMPTYIAVTKERPDLLAELDRAMESVSHRIPPVREVLSRKYFADSPMRRMLDAREFPQPVVIAELVSMLFLFVAMFLVFGSRETFASTWWLKCLTITNLASLVADVLAYSIYTGWCSEFTSYVIYYLSYTLGNLGLFASTGFAWAYIRGVTPLGRRYLAIPGVLSAIAVVLISVAFFGGRIVVFANGAPYDIGAAPPLASLIQIFLLAAYMPGLALLKRKEVGMSSVLLLSVFGLFPSAAIVIAFLTGEDYSLAASVVSLVFVAYELHRSQVERRLKQMNEQLRVANENEKRYLQAEAMERANKAKSYFFSTVSHDIRTPLNAIIGYAELLKLGIGDKAEFQKAVDSVLVSGRTLLELINDVLDLSKLEAGKMEILPEPVDVGRLVQEVADAFRATIGGKPMEILVEVKAMPWLKLDPQRIRQILFNLVGNAVKFTEQGHVAIRAEYVRQTGEGADVRRGTFRFSVSDTGCGISEEDQRRVALPYVQVGRDASRGKGTGLGLAICKQLIARMGGELGLESALGKGTTFTVSIPDAEEDVEHARPPTASGPSVAFPAADQPPTYRRVLVVDDVAMNRMVLKTMLRKFGIPEIEMAENGFTALKKLTQEAPFDMVLTDMWMPGMDGDGLVREIRKNPAWDKLPVYAVTADVEAQKAYAGKGFSGILLKPLTFEKLQEFFRSLGAGL